MATPSSRPNPGATPTHLTSSPRPSGPLPRPASHKSPSTRTPSAFQGPPPSSTQLYATPLVAPGGVIDDPVTFSSPSALLALSGYAGITPSPAGHDGLVAAAGMNESDIQALGMHGLKLGGPRDSDEERRRNIDHVVQLLRTRVAGRGVCREGIERLGQLEGFESIWQEDSLNIAGNFVDLEIEFHRGENTVQDVSLKYATPEATEGERREEATAVLKRGLIQPSEDEERGAWKSLAGFHENLQWLARHDRLSQEVNCFEAIEGLYESLRRVWDAEGSQGKIPGVYERLCQANVGRPFLHQEGRIGLGLDYWVWQARVVDAQCKRNKGSDGMEIDQSDDVPESLKGRWSVAVECEEGYPSLRVSKEWVGPEPLTRVDNPGDEPDMVVNWTDPPATVATNSQGHPDAMALDANMLGSALNRRFVARLEPPLDVPIIVGSDIYRQLGFDIPQEFRVVTYDGITYDGLLAPGWSPVSAATAMGLGLEDAYQLGRKRRRMSVSAVDVDGKPYKKWHTYTFQPFESTQGRTIRDIVFAHPRQLAEIFPVLRQYASLANMIRSIFNNDRPEEIQQESPNGFPSPKGSENLSGTKSTNTIISNDDPNELKLNWLLNWANHHHSSSSSSNGSTITSTNDTTPDDTPHKGDSHNNKSSNSNSIINSTNNDVKVDVTLRTQLSHPPVIMLLFTVTDTQLGIPTSASGTTPRKVSISLEVGLNGQIAVVDMAGLLEDPYTNDTDTDATAGTLTDEAIQLQRQMAQVLEISQDIGVLVEWILRWARRRQQQQQQ